MKSCICILFYLIGWLPVQAQPDTGYANHYYLQRLSFFKALPKQGDEIVFLGNSITEAGEWQELLPGKKVLNRGISGDVTYGILGRIDEVLASKPSKIFLLIGINDLKRGIPVCTIADTYRRIVKTMRELSPTTELYLQSVLPVNTKLMATSYQRINNELVRQLNEKIITLATEFHCVYVPLNEIFSDADGQLKKEYTPDGIHLWPLSYIRWVKFLKDNKHL